MTILRRVKGLTAERWARDYLEEQGLKWVASNWHIEPSREEIDLIMQEGEFVVFVEVRSRKNADHGHPLDSINPLKQRHIINAATVYLIKNRIYDKVACRFDVVGVTQNGEENQLVWIKDAFRAHY